MCSSPQALRIDPGDDLLDPIWTMIIDVQSIFLLDGKDGFQGNFFLFPVYGKRVSTFTPLDIISMLFLPGGEWEGLAQRSYERF